MKYIVQYTLPYEHRVMVGIEAASPDEAIAKANELFDQGAIWDDTSEVPLLFDDFEENGDAGVPLEFTVEDEVGKRIKWLILPLHESETDRHLIGLSG